MRLLAMVTITAEFSHCKLIYFRGFIFHFGFFNHTQEMLPLVGRGISSWCQFSQRNLMCPIKNRAH